MARDQTELTKRISTLRAFAMVATGRHPAVDATLLQLIREHDAGPRQEAGTRIFRELYRRLRDLNETAHDAAAARGASIRAWADFDRLRPCQRAALFLVLTAGFSIREAASILDLTRAEVSHDIERAVFYLEDVYPPALPPLPAKTQANGEVHA